VGVLELSDIVFATEGALPGAILIEWNVHEGENDKGGCGMWDIHTRVGGTKGTNLEENCLLPQYGNNECVGAFMLVHITKDASAYLENTWFWVADHVLDYPG
jgi:hypothetical protein